LASEARINLRGSIFLRSMAEDLRSSELDFDKSSFGLVFKCFQNTKKDIVSVPEREKKQFGLRYIFEFQGCGLALLATFGTC